MLHTAVMKSESPVIKAVLAGGKDYGRQVRDKGSGHGLGLRALTVAYQLVTALSEEDVGAANKQKLKEAVELWDQADRPAVEEVIKVCRWETCHDEAKLKVVFHFAKPELTRVVNNLLTQVGADVKAGRAPRTKQEEDFAE